MKLHVRWWWQSVSIVAVLVALSPVTHAEEDPLCLSPNPLEWPASSKPYFLLAVDTSGSMDSGYEENSCGYPSNRIGGARCAIRNTVQAYGGLVNFGLMAFPREIEFTHSSPSSTCEYVPDGAWDGCRVRSLYREYALSAYDNNRNTCGDSGNTSDRTDSRGGNILVPLQQDNHWSPTPTPSNVEDILLWVDNDCGNCQELWAHGWTPLNGLLRDSYRYLSSSWSRPRSTEFCWGNGDCLRNCSGGACDCLGDGDCREGYFCDGGLCARVPSPWCDYDTQCVSGNCSNHGCTCADDTDCPTGVHCVDGYCGEYPTPLSDLVEEKRSCRSVNVILLTDGVEFCEPNAGSNNNDAALAAATAADLFAGFDTGTGTDQIHWSVRTHVIALGTVAGVDNIASNGGTTEAKVANNEAELSAALANIISGAIPPETCNNADDNCNGCSDEGFRTYCNRNKDGLTLAELQAPEYEPDPDDCCIDARNDCLDAFRASIDPDTNPQGSKELLPCWTPSGTDLDPELSWVCFDPGESCDGEDNNCEASWQNLVSNQADEGFDKCDDGDANQCPTTEICDGLDNDCSGYPDDLTEEECAADDQCVDNLCPIPCFEFPEVCDNADNDCDDEVDEDLWVPCGLPDALPGDRCYGVRSCTAGVWGDCDWSASPNDPTCDGVDDDCDGLNDEDWTGGACDPGDGLVYNDDSRCRAVMVCASNVESCEVVVGPLLQEVCNGVDDDCDGEIDEDPQDALIGTACGVTVPNSPCQGGTWVCDTDNGRLTCDGVRQGQQPESCNGIDDDCNGDVDDGVLDDAPATPGCWQVDASECEVSEQCTHEELTWCPPPGGACDGLGTLFSPCAPGTMSCLGGEWVCDGGRLPSDEVCDGVDNDCDDESDEVVDLLLFDPIIGTPCGENIPNSPCSEGENVCDNGTYQCSGGNPEPEVCDGVDNDCDGTVDNGLALGEDCEATYDTTTYPGDRTGGECRPGSSACNPDDPTTPLCVGGVGPQPEVCDGKDNDCDGDVDESGPAPDGIDGTADPFDTNEPPRRLGDRCGTNEGLCLEGQLGCVDGQVICVGGVAAQVETCDCSDNDCDGDADEPPSGNEPALCSPGKTCVDAGDFCLCVETCGGGEFPCPTGTQCETVPESYSREEDAYCLPSVEDLCGDCASKTIRDTDERVVCAPTGSVESSRPIPECVCKGSAGCQSPCYNVQCPAGQECVPTGPATGECQQQNNCYFFGCTEGRACVSGACVDNPCDPSPCEADEVCKPAASFIEASCVGSCAGVTCTLGQTCVGGECVDTPCENGCGADEYCTEEGNCVESQCDSSDGLACADGAYCDPATGSCGTDPCSGVVCPNEQECRAGECYDEAPVVPVGGASNAGGANNAGAVGGAENTTGGATTAGTPGTGSRPTRPPEGPTQGAWGLATGGGGCSCRTGPRHHAAWGSLLASLVGLAGLRRRKRSNARLGRAATRGGEL